MGISRNFEILKEEEYLLVRPSTGGGPEAQNGNVWDATMFWSSTPIRKKA